MAFIVPAVSGWILYGVPPALLLVALGRSLKTARRAAWVYGLCLAGWLGHVAVVHRGTTLLPATVRIEPPGAVSFTSPQIAELGERSVLQVQAPASLDWTLHGDERRLDFAYGIMPAAYEGGGTDGAGVSVTLSRAGIVRTVFHRLLDPRNRPEDRGPQHTRLVLPPVAPGEKLTLAVDAGPAGQNAWDWVHFSDVGFTRSTGFLPGQFPSFSRVPDAVEAPFSALFERNDQPFFLHLHAPARFEYVLHRTEQKARFLYGFLPGAYQNGNATDGARFLVLLQPAAGPARVLLDRELAPLTRAADRGPHPAELALGAHAAGDRLVFRIEPGPAGSNSWDWTYFSGLSLEDAR